MHLIFTHEQADFDAIASLWAASLLNPGALPVLPGRLNRNVRGFLTLYGGNFPISAIGDLDVTSIDRLTLVDSQRLPSVKGVDANTQVYVIDHHPVEADLNPAWTIQIEQVGATATLLAERLQTAGEEPSGTEATLLLLGIYEDTGSLTYPGTTPRDVRASAWLLEQGASLTIAGEFLDQPLSAEQRELFEQLMDSATVTTIQGLDIVVATGQATGTSDEISTLAHKLGDVFDVVALFLIVALNGKVQLVARSYSAAVNVGAVAESFGGGGHKRAAAALVKGTTVEELAFQLQTFLARTIEPPSKVGEIMSRGPQLLEPAETVAEAAERMKRYGHEGYPVTDDGEVVGLLTRRAVDRAVAHGMSGNRVSDIMEAGSLVVHPDDSIHHLQRVMIEHNWGQVPVSDPGSGEVIGIVTRTDLLNSLGNSTNSQASPGLADELEQALSAGRLALLRLIAREAENSDVALYIVGGFVRDLILGTPSVDFDLVVEGDAIALGGTLAKNYGGHVSSHRRFGTAKWRLDRENQALNRALQVDLEKLPKTVDFVSARTEFYSHPTALPSVTEGSIKLDLHRRDFSINTLAVRLDGHHYGQLLDPWGGGRDIREQQIRVLHSLSFVDDPTRMLRAVRLEQRLGFTIEKRTLELLERALPLLDSVSGERVRSEIDAVLTEGRFAPIMQRLQYLGLLQAIYPALEWDDWTEKRSTAAREFSPPSAWKLERTPSVSELFYGLWTYRLSASEAAAVCDRLSVSQTEAVSIMKAGRQDCDLAQERPASEWVNCLEGQPEAALVATWLALQDGQGEQEIIHNYLSEWRWVQPKTSGEVLRESGLAPGPAYGRILADLRAAWLDEQIQTADQESELLEELIAAEKSRG